MKVTVREISFEELPDPIAAFVQQPVPLTPGKEYDVHAIAVFETTLLFQLVDETEDPSWLPAWFFDVVDHSIPADWIANRLRDAGVELLLGPEFVARDLASYEGMVELHPNQVDRFWQRISQSAQ